jgi:pilus assembly protein CpaB
MSEPRAADLPEKFRSRIGRLLPTGLVGQGRRPAWNRTRLRRVISAGLVAAAAWLALGAFLPKTPPRGIPVVVVSRDLMPGHVLTPGDLAVADWPRDLGPAGAVPDPRALVGKALGAGMSRGEAVTAARVRGPGLLTGARSGFVASHIRLADAAMAAMAAPGDHVDLISSAGQVVASDVVVLAVDAGPEGSNGWSTKAGSAPPSGVVVAVESGDAERLATSDPSGLSAPAFNLVLRAPIS